MYIRTTKRQNKDGSVTEYLQLAHNEWDKKSARSVAKVLINFGRKEDVDVKGLERLVASIQRFLASLPGYEHNIPASGVEVLASKVYGGCWLLDQLWQQFQIGDYLKRALSKTDYEIPIERSLFAMVANRAVDPASKLSTEHWVDNVAYIPGLPSVSVHQLYLTFDSK